MIWKKPVAFLKAAYEEEANAGFLSLERNKRMKMIKAVQRLQESIFDLLIRKIYSCLVSFCKAILRLVRIKRLMQMIPKLLQYMPSKLL